MEEWVGKKEQMTKQLEEEIRKHISKEKKKKSSCSRNDAC
jgi:hypothetical protein